MSSAFILRIFIHHNGSRNITIHDKKLKKNNEKEKKKKENLTRTYILTYKQASFTIVIDCDNLYIHFSVTKPFCACMCVCVESIEYI